MSVAGGQSGRIKPTTVFVPHDPMGDVTFGQYDGLILQVCTDTYIATSPDYTPPHSIGAQSAAFKQYDEEPFA